MTLSIAVHSLRGGTGKTLLSMNLAAFFVKQGFRVVIIDMDLGAPSLQSYIKDTNRPKINAYFAGTATPEDVIFDATDIVGRDVPGKLYMGLASDKSEIISAMSQRDKQTSLDELYKLMSLVREKLPGEPWAADFIILDTSPGFAPSSLNCVAATEHLILMMRLVNADLGGSGQMLKALHTSLKPNTSLILNQVPKTFMEDDAEGYTRDLVRKHIIDPLGSDKVKICGFMSNDVEVLEKEGEFAMYLLEGVNAQRPIHSVINPNGELAMHIENIAACFLGLE